MCLHFYVIILSCMLFFKINVYEIKIETKCLCCVFVMHLYTFVCPYFLLFVYFRDSFWCFPNFRYTFKMYSSQINPFFVFKCNGLMLCALLIVQLFFSYCILYFPGSFQVLMLCVRESFCYSIIKDRIIRKKYVKCFLNIVIFFPHEFCWIETKFEFILLVALLN